MNDLIQSTAYRNWLSRLKKKFTKAQLKAAVSVNTALLEFYWDLGADIVAKQKYARWGSGFLKQLSIDLMEEFPGVKGFSLNNLQYIKRWYLFYCIDGNESGTSCSTIGKYSKRTIKGQPVTRLFQVPWGHNLVIISKSKTVEEAFFYVESTIKNGWSRSVLVHQIESGLYYRQGKAFTNFQKTLPKPQSDLAQQLLKDPYHFDFLNLNEKFNEKELENSLLDHITRFLLELGNGFAFLGRQKILVVGQRDFYPDLLFYHTRLHCYVVIELKTGDFEPEYAGKLNFYIKAVDEQLKSVDDKPTIGILLCKNKDDIVVEYSLSDIAKPMGVSQYKLVSKLPKELKNNLPDIQQIKEGLKKLNET